MAESNAKPATSAPNLNPGDRLSGKDAEGNDAVFVVISVHQKLNADGSASASYVLRQRDSWTITIGEASLLGETPRFRPIEAEDVPLV